MSSIQQCMGRARQAGTGISSNVPLEVPPPGASHACVWGSCFCSSSPGKDKHTHLTPAMPVQSLFLAHV